jgi:hypothetical protein
VIARNQNLEDANALWGNIIDLHAGISEEDLTQAEARAFSCRIGHVNMEI